MPAKPWSLSRSTQIRRDLSRFRCTRGVTVCSFHSSTRWSQGPSLPDHYETLGLKSSSSPIEIKRYGAKTSRSDMTVEVAICRAQIHARDANQLVARQFYKLSKSYHPDLHPNDVAAPQRFVEISEAYAVLGSVEKKTQYDRDYHRVHGNSRRPTSSSTPGGSFSSASTPAGGRPASGLSRRRTQFQGPPPSFYRNGAWGQYEEKRRAAANEGSSQDSSPREYRESSDSVSGAPGVGPGGHAMGFDNDVSHFDHKGHRRTHSDIERTRHRARRKRSARVSEPEFEHGGPDGDVGVAFNFFIVTGILALVVTSGFVFGGLSRSDGPKKPPSQDKQQS